tara:strand:+ start:641 stop:898 length:258 start_codon:yes stop_codon:yes gene_type:complete
MPRYQYECDECGFELLVRHSMEETLVECPSCESEALVRIMPNISLPVKRDKASPQAGTLVKEAIREAREEVKKDLRKAQKEEYEP